MSKPRECTDCQQFLDFCKQYGDDSAVEVLERICDAQWNNGEGEGVTFCGIHHHDAINAVVSGSIQHDGKEWQFIIENGNYRGTVVLEWGTVDDVGVYQPPPPTRYMFVPRDPTLKTHRPAMWRAYLSWKKQDWFQEKLRAYHYDRHFAPGEATEKHYRDWAASKGMVISIDGDDA